MRHHSVIRWAVGVLLGFGCLGCGSSGSSHPTARLEGQVTVDGQPVAEGTIVFMSQGSGQARPTQAAIRDGRYAASDVPVGDVQVRFVATKKTGKVTPIPNSNEVVEEVVSLIPSKYELGIPIKVSPEGGIQDFELKTP